MWVQVQQRVRRHDLRVEADTVEMQRTKRRSIGLDAAFVDLTKAFDTISLSGSFRWLSPKFLTILRQLHENH